MLVVLEEPQEGEVARPNKTMETSMEMKMEAPQEEELPCREILSLPSPATPISK